MYFLTPRKCGLFGVSCEGLQKQVNYLIDEGMSSTKGSNEVISYMHHFFGNFGVGETEVDLHCDNCSGQNKNNFMLWYLAWRVGHKLHDKIEIHFLIAGHTKFSPDCGFGLIKQAYMKTRVNTLADIAEVVENSSPVSHLNIPQLVGTAEGKVLVQTFDWQQHLTRHFRRLPQIKSYQHFSFEAKRPGVVLAKVTVMHNLSNISYCADGADLPPVDGLPVLAPPGLKIDRQTYLYEKIRPFCADEARDITCPAPRVTTQKSPQKRMRIMQLIPPSGGRGKLLNNDQELAIVEMVVANNAIKLHEIQTRIVEDHEIFDNIDSISLTTITRTLSKHRVRMKQLYTVPFERNSERVKEL
ncbi:uncharacterized protein LOC127645673 [Xyrauchen texanus]|uniref:uncharacterized protein LOC127645673 n=1 Tax=Xyrauchen texanus TaxID=154827 RepID=UPI002242A80D|nr:uncharacterized protein LOC127645673 [Xyrauchen texanus]